MRICLVYKVACYQKIKILKNTLKGLTRPCSPRSYSELSYTEVSGVASQYILWYGNFRYSLRSSILKSKRIFSVVISKLIPAFSTLQLDVAKNHINYYVTNNNSRSLRGVRTRTRHIQNQKHIQNPGIFTTLVYSEPHYIQNTGIFKI